MYCRQRVHKLAYWIIDRTDPPAWVLERFGSSLTALWVKNNLGDVIVEDHDRPIRHDHFEQIYEIT